MSQCLLVPRVGYLRWPINRLNRRSKTREAYCTEHFVLQMFSFFLQIGQTLPNPNLKGKLPLGVRPKLVQNGPTSFSIFALIGGLVESPQLRWLMYASRLLIIENLWKPDVITKSRCTMLYLISSFLLTDLMDQRLSCFTGSRGARNLSALRKVASISMTAMPPSGGSAKIIGGGALMVCNKVYL